MPDKERLFAVLQPVAVDVADSLVARNNQTTGFQTEVCAQPVPIQDGREMQKAQNGIGIGQQGDPAYTLDTTGAQAIAQPVPLFDQGDVRATTVAVAFASNLGTRGGDVYDDGVSPTVRTGSSGTSGHPPAVACPTLTAHNDPSRSPQSSEVTQQVAAVHAASMTVRRLTPVECERLQAFPDGYTAIPWRGKPAEQCPDGPRYKALGNSMAVNCMAWIGERIAAVEARHD